MKLNEVTTSVKESPSTQKSDVEVLQDLKDSGKAPSFLDLEGYKTLSQGYLVDGETPADMYRRLASNAAKILGKPELEPEFYNALFKGWLCPATPVASNFGLDRALAISCFSQSMDDSVDGIFKANHELAMLSKNGGGVAVCMSNVRGRGSPIKGNGKSEGIIPWIKCLDSTTVAVSQGSVRRGATAVYLDVNHPDFDEFLRIRRPSGDINRQCLNIHHGVVIDDAFMQKVEQGDSVARNKWVEILKTRFETGEPYIMFSDTVNNANPETYKTNGLRVETSNLCSEILLHTDKDHTFVCCLSSLNLSKYDEWKDTNIVKLGIYFLDAVMQDFINKSKDIPGLERARRFAIKSRALGLGVLGWHTLLQSKMIPIDSLKANLLNKVIFKQIRTQADEATKELAVEFGEPSWCKNSGRRNTHTLALAPTVSNSTISGNVSAGIEPIAGNAFTKKGSKGTFFQKNPIFKNVLIKHNKDNDDVWKSIISNEGSVQHLEFLTAVEKEVFLTAREINQLVLIKQAADRQQYIDQGQSLNLFFPVNVDPKWFHKIHMDAWKLGIKTLYYTRTGSVLKADSASRFYSDECKSCEG